MPTDTTRPVDSGNGATARPVWWARTWVRLSLCFAVVATIPLVVTAIYTTQRHIEVVRAQGARAAADRAEAAARSLNEGLSAAYNDLLTLAELRVLGGSLHASTDDSDGPSAGDDFWQAKVVQQFRTFLEINPAYASIAYVEHDGDRVVELIRRGTATQVVETEGNLDRKLPWLGDALDLLERQVAFHVEPQGGDLVVTMAARVESDAGVPGAIVSLTVRCGQFVPAWASSSGNDATEQDDRPGIAIFNRNGTRMYCAPDPAFESAEPPPVSQWWRHMQFTTADGRLISTAPVTTIPNRQDQQWLLMLDEPDDVIEAGVVQFRNAFLGCVTAALLAAVSLGVWLARRYTMPVRKLYDAASRVGRGDFDVELVDDTGDELGELASRVNVMIGELRDMHGEFERRLQEKSEQLVHAERLATIGRTAAAVAHEINNPSGIISMYAQLLIESAGANGSKGAGGMGRDNSAGAAANIDLAKLKIIDAKAQEISRIVRELLDYSRKPAPQMEWASTERIIADAVQVASIPESTVRVHVNVQPDAGMIRVDPEQIVRVVRNLIVNACHAMPGGGDLTVRCSREDSSHVMLSVADTGSGMNDEQRRLLFEPFYTTKRFGAGTGLGLAISKEIVERHGGSIGVESVEGAGTTVSVRLASEEHRETVEAEHTDR